MKRLTIFLMLLASACIAAQAQQTSRLNPDDFRTEIRFKGGFFMPATSAEYAGGGSAVFGADYAWYFSRHFGCSAGFQFNSNYLGCGNVIGAPLALTYRTRNRRLENVVENGVFNMANVFIWSRGSRSMKDILTDFVLSLFSRGELYAGITPGLVTGSSYSREVEGSDGTLHTAGIDLDSRFSTTFDLGFGWSYRISHVYLTLLPAYHYCLVKNYVAVEDGVRQAAIRSHFSFSAGISYSF